LKLSNYTSNNELSLTLEHCFRTSEERLDRGIYLNCKFDKYGDLNNILKQIIKEHDNWRTLESVTKDKIKFLENDLEMKNKLLENNSESIKNLQAKYQQIINTNASIEAKHNQSQNDIKDYEDQIKGLRNAHQGNITTIMYLSDVNKNNEDKIRTLEFYLSDVNKNDKDKIRTLEDTIKNNEDKIRTLKLFKDVMNLKIY